MNNMQKIFQVYGPEYLEKFGDRMPEIQKKAIWDISNCRGDSFGTYVFECRDCQSIHSIPCCCGNRHCPLCQYGKNELWLNKQLANLLPTHYFLYTVTLPEGLRSLVRSSQKVAYAAMFSCIHDALKDLARDKRFIGSSKIGYVAVLHTWGGTLQYHPHLHLVIPGGALSEKKDRWLTSRQDLFVHTKPLAVLFREKFKAALKKANLFNATDPDIWTQQWVIDRQAVGKGDTALRYLSRYLFRVAISNNRVKHIEDHRVTFSYKDHRDKKWKTLTLEVMEFIRRFLQHILPKGFMKVRHYGFLNPNSSLSIEKIRDLIGLIHEVIHRLIPKTKTFKPKDLTCSKCGKSLTFLYFIKPVPIWRCSG